MDERRLAERMLDLLVSRNGVRTIVVLEANKKIVVENVAWGRDIGAEYDHITTNVSPPAQTLSVDFFLTSEIRAVIDPDTGTTLLEA